MEGRISELQITYPQQSESASIAMLKLENESLKTLAITTAMEIANLRKTIGSMEQENLLRSGGHDTLLTPRASDLLHKFGNLPERPGR